MHPIRSSLRFSRRDFASQRPASEFKSSDWFIRLFYHFSHSIDRSLQILRRKIKRKKQGRKRVDLQAGWAPRRAQAFSSALTARAGSVQRSRGRRDDRATGSKRFLIPADHCLVGSSGDTARAIRPGRKTKGVNVDNYFLRFFPPSMR